MTTTKTIKIEVDEEKVMAKVMSRIGEILTAERCRLADALDVAAREEMDSCEPGCEPREFVAGLRLAADWIRKDAL